MSKLEISQKNHEQTWIEINTENLIHNLETLKGTQPHASVLAVIKANGYGHGLLQIAKALENKVTYLGITSLREALLLKEQKIETPLFLFGKLAEDEISAAILDSVTLSISNFEEAKNISEKANALGKIARIHIKVDTGMGRLGIPLSEAISQIEKSSELGHIFLEGIYTHFPSAEIDDNFRARQIRDFKMLIAALEQKDIFFEYKHIANTAGCLLPQDTDFNMIRPGIGLYGIQPYADFNLHLKPVLSLKSKVIMVKRLQSGGTVGYAKEFIAKEATNIAILPIGYSHGYPFRAWKNTKVLFNGKAFSLAGRISMDYMAINLGNQYIRVGDIVTLIGENGNENIRMEDIAKWSDTIPYEIATSLNPNIIKIIAS